MNPVNNITPIKTDSTVSFDFNGVSYVLKHNSGAQQYMIRNMGADIAEPMYKVMADPKLQGKDKADERAAAIAEATIKFIKGNLSLVAVALTKNKGNKGKPPISQEDIDELEIEQSNDLYIAIMSCFGASQVSPADVPAEVEGESEESKTPVPTEVQS